MGVVSCGIGGLVVAHVGRRLLFGRSPRQCAMPRHNGNFSVFIVFDVIFFSILSQYPSRFLPLEKIGEEMGWRHCKRLVKIGEKDWKKDWQRLYVFFLSPHK